MASISHDTKTRPWQAALRGRAPTISVVATVMSRIVPATWLSELAKRCKQLDAELILVSGVVPSPDIVRNDHHEVRLVIAEQTNSQLHLRALGTQAAQGDIVVFVNERELIDATALNRLVRAGLGRGGLQRRNSIEVEVIPPTVGVASVPPVRHVASGRSDRELGEEIRESTV